MSDPTTSPVVAAAEAAIPEIANEVTHSGIFAKIKDFVEGVIAHVEGIDGGKLKPEEIDAAKAVVDAGIEAAKTAL